MCVGTLFRVCIYDGATVAPVAAVCGSRTRSKEIRADPGPTLTVARSSLEFVFNEVLGLLPPLSLRLSLSHSHLTYTSYTAVCLASREIVFIQPTCTHHLSEAFTSNLCAEEILIIPYVTLYFVWKEPGFFVVVAKLLRVLRCSCSYRIRTVVFKHCKLIFGSLFCYYMEYKGENV